MKRALFLAALCITGASCASDHCTRATEFVPALCPLHLPAVVSVQVEHTGVKAAAAKDDPVECTSFRLDESAVRRFLARAKAVDENAARHVLDWSPCSSDGVLQLSDGRTVHWQIDESATGWLDLGATTRQAVYCPECTFRPFPRGR